MKGFFGADRQPQPQITFLTFLKAMSGMRGGLDHHAVIPPPAVGVTESRATAASWCPSTHLIEIEMFSKHQKSTGDHLPLSVGTSVVALRDFGPIRKGLPGIITGTAKEPFFQGNRPVYLCTFAGNMKSLTRPQSVEASEHGYSLDDLESDNFSDVVARRKAAELPPTQD